MIAGGWIALWEIQDISEIIRGICLNTQQTNSWLEMEHIECNEQRIMAVVTPLKVLSSGKKICVENVTHQPLSMARMEKRLTNELEAKKHFTQQKNNHIF